MSDPKRLLHTGSDLVERALLESAMTPGPTNEQCDALWEALENRLGVVTGSGSQATSANGARPESTVGSASPATMAWGAAAVAVGAAVAAAFFAWSAHDQRTARPYLAGGIGQPAPQVLVPPSSGTSTAPSTIPSTVRVPPVAPVSSSAARPPVPHKPASKIVELARPPEGSESSLREESQLLLRARRAWQARDCTGALTQLDEARRRFPSGALVQEREALAIEALACVGRSKEAATRAASFLREYPTSPHAEALRQFER
jgi:hypothetical protein